MPGLQSELVSRPHVLDTEAGLSVGLVGAAITLLLRAGHTDGLVPRVQDYVHVRAGRCGEGVPTITSPVMTGSSEAAWQVCWGQELPVFLRKWEEHRLVHQSEHTGWHWGLWEEQAWEPEWRGRAGGGGSCLPHGSRDTRQVPAL